MVLVPAVWDQLLLQLVLQNDHLICTLCILPFKGKDLLSFYMTAESPEEYFLVPCEKFLVSFLFTRVSLFSLLSFLSVHTILLPLRVSNPFLSMKKGLLICSYPDLSSTSLKLTNNITLILGEISLHHVSSPEENLCKDDFQDK